MPGSRQGRDRCRPALQALTYLPFADTGYGVPLPLREEHSQEWLCHKRREIPGFPTPTKVVGVNAKRRHAPTAVGVNAIGTWTTRLQN